MCSYLSNTLEMMWKLRRCIRWSSVEGRKAAPRRIHLPGSRCHRGLCHQRQSYAEHGAWFFQIVSSEDSELPASSPAVQRVQFSYGLQCIKPFLNLCTTTAEKQTSDPRFSQKRHAKKDNFYLIVTLCSLVLQSTGADFSNYRYSKTSHNNFNRKF